MVHINIFRIKDNHLPVYILILTNYQPQLQPQFLEQSCLLRSVIEKMIISPCKFSTPSYFLDMGLTSPRAISKDAR